MGLFSPWWLLGIAALGLPVWLHLLQQHKMEVQRFPSLQFFEKRQQSSVKHRRLKYRMLFALRALLLLLLALLFAQPFIRRDIAGLNSSRHVLLLVDNSFSMRAGGALDRAKEEALKAVDSLKSGESAQVLSLGAGVNLVTQPTTDKAELRSAIQSIAPGASRSAFAEIGRTARTIAQSVKLPVAVQLFSDLQKTSMPTTFSELSLPEGTTLSIHNVQAGKVPNFAVEAVTAPSIVADPKKTRILATISGFATPAATRNVTLSVNGKTVQSKSVNLPAAGRATVEFTGFDASYGWNRGQVSIDAADSLPGDDVFRFASERADPRPVLFLHEPGRTRGALYFRSALESAAENLFTIDAMPAGQAANVSPFKYAFVVISDVTNLAPELIASLKKYVTGGGGVLVALGASAGTRPAEPLTGRKVLESRYAARGAERFFSPAGLDLTHPAVRLANRWEGVRFFQVIRVEPGSAAVVARINDNTPLLLDERLGAGRILTFTSSLDNVANDFPLHPSFLPFVDQVSRYLAQVESRPATLTVDSAIELRAEGAKAASAVEVLDPQGRRALDLKAASTALSIRADQEGFYEVNRQNNRKELVAVNADRAESNLEPMPKESVEIWAATGSSGTSGVAEAQNDQRNASLWWYVLLLLLIALLAEAFVASKYMEPETAG